jgi:hypothetical protein
MNSASGSQIGGTRSFAPESSKAAMAKPSRICETAIENKIEMSEPHVK